MSKAVGGYLFIVRQDQPELSDYFRRWFSGIPHVEVVSDRRRGERRRGGGRHDPERRQGDRRLDSGINEEILQTGFAIVETPGS